MKFKIEFKDVGRDKFNATIEKEIVANDLQTGVDKCLDIAYSEVKKHLFSSGIDIEPQEEEYKDVNNYFVYVGGFRHVGDVVISLIQ